MISYKEAKEILGDAVDCPAAGDDIAAHAVERGDYETAAAAKLLGSMQCLGHHRAERMKDAAMRYWNLHVQGAKP